MSVQSPPPFAPPSASGTGGAAGRPVPLAARVALALATAAGGAAVAWFVLGRIVPGSEEVKIAATVAFFVLLGAVVGKAVKGREELRVPARAGVLAGGLALLLFGYLGPMYLWGGEEVQEELVTPAPQAQQAPPAAPSGGEREPAPAPEPTGPQLVASGSFAALEHPGSGTAEIVEDGDRTVVQLRDFSTDSGPDLRLYLSNGTDASGEFVDLGALKGNSGNQSYELPRGTDPADFSHVLVWCRAFSVGFTAAELERRG